MQLRWLGDPKILCFILLDRTKLAIADDAVNFADKNREIDAMIGDVNFFFGADATPYLNDGLIFMPDFMVQA